MNNAPGEKGAIGRVLSVSGSEARIGLSADALRSAAGPDRAVFALLACSRNRKAQPHRYLPGFVSIFASKDELMVRPPRERKENTVLALLDANNTTPGRKCNCSPRVMPVAFH